MPANSISTRDRFRGCLLGLACGDALGTTVEFRPRGTFSPVTDMVGGGPFRLSPGEWTDDTSMALCLATSLVECLEAALWCFYRTDSYRDAVLMAVNLGQDADTTAAVCGQLASAYYGEAAIPEAWQKCVTKHNLIVELVERLM